MRRESVFVNVEILEQIRAYHKQSTEGRWMYSTIQGQPIVLDRDLQSLLTTETESGASYTAREYPVFREETDARFCAYAHDDIPWLLKLIDDLCEERGELMLELKRRRENDGA